MTHEKVINFDDREEKRSVLIKLGALTGKWLFTAKPYRPRRSLKANAYYRGVVVPTFQTFLRNHGQYFEPDEVHEYLLAEHATKPLIDPKTGEVLRYVAKRSSTMDSAEFADFVNFCIEWMFDRFGVVVPEPDADWRRKRAA